MNKAALEHDKTNNVAVYHEKTRIGLDMMSAWKSLNP